MTDQEAIEKITKIIKQHQDCFEQQRLGVLTHTPRTIAEIVINTLKEFGYLRPPEGEPPIVDLTTTGSIYAWLLDQRDSDIAWFKEKMK